MTTEKNEQDKCPQCGNKELWEQGGTALYICRSCGWVFRLEEVRE